MVRKVRTVLIGLGSVNQGLLRILVHKGKDIEQAHQIQFIIVGVADSSGISVNSLGYHSQELLDLKSKEKKAKSLEGHLPGVPTEDITDCVEADLLIESSPANLRTGNPGLQVAKNALGCGWKVVFANKTPLVFAFNSLSLLAKENNTSMAFSATVCGGLPVINVLHRDLKVTNLKNLTGVFNATSNFILEELEKGGSLESAIAEAQRLGAAEADPLHDITGKDTANKLFIIMKSFTDFDGTIEDIDVIGIQFVTADIVKEAVAEGNRLKLIASAKREHNKWKLSVMPQEIEMSSFLGSCNGWEMGIEIQTDLYDSISMKNYEADPLGTSAAVLRDAIDLFTG